MDWDQLLPELQLTKDEIDKAMMKGKKKYATCDRCTWYIGNQKSGAPNLMNVDQNNLQQM